MCLESDLYPQEFKDQCEKEVKRKKKTETREVKRDPKKFGPLHRNFLLSLRETGVLRGF